MFKQSVTLFCIILASQLDASAQDFGSHFTDKTLRIDYHFSGDAHQQVIALAQPMAKNDYGKYLMRLAEQK